MNNSKIYISPVNTVLVRKMKNSEIIEMFVHGGESGHNSTGSLRIVRNDKGISKCTYLYSYATPIAYRVYDKSFGVRYYLVTKKFSTTTSRHQHMLKEEIKFFMDGAVTPLTDTYLYEAFKSLLNSNHMEIGRL